MYIAHIAYCNIYVYIKSQREKIFAKKLSLCSFICDRCYLVNRKILPEAIISCREIVLADIFNPPTFSSIRLFFLSQLSQTEIVSNRIRVSIYIKRTETRGRNLRSGKYNIVLLASIVMLAGRTSIREYWLKNVVKNS